MERPIQPDQDKHHDQITIRTDPLSRWLLNNPVHNVLKLLGLGFLLGLMLGLSQPSHARGKLVYDPTNFAKNLITSKKTIGIEQQAIVQSRMQAEYLFNSYQQLKRLDPKQFEADAKSAAEQLAAIKAYELSTAAVSRALDSQGDFIDAVQRNYVRTGDGDFRDYGEVLARRAAAGDLTARALFDMHETTSMAVSTSVKRRQELQKQVQDNEGIMQQAATTNQYLDLLTSQNENIQQLLSEQIKLLGEEKAKKAASEAEAGAYAKDAQAREKAALESFPQRWNTNTKK